MKKRNVIGVTLGTIVAIGIFVGSMEDEPVVNQEPIKQEEKTEKPKPKKEEPKKEEPVLVEEPKVDNNDEEQVVLNIMNTHFTGIADIEFDSEMKTYNITPTDPQILVELVSLSSGDVTYRKSWDYLVGTFIDMSQTTKERVGSGYSIILVNPANIDNILLMATDGVLMYNAFE